MRINLVKIFLVLKALPKLGLFCAYKSYQNISSSVGMTKSRSFAQKCCQNFANLLCRKGRADKKGSGPQSSAGTVIYIIVGELSITARRIHSIYRKFVRLQGWAVSH